MRFRLRSRSRRGKKCPTRGGAAGRVGVMGVTLRTGAFLSLALVGIGCSNDGRTRCNFDRDCPAGEECEQGACIATAGDAGTAGGGGTRAAPAPQVARAQRAVGAAGVPGAVQAAWVAGVAPAVALRSRAPAAARLTPAMLRARCTAAPMEASALRVTLLARTAAQTAPAAAVRKRPAGRTSVAWGQCVCDTTTCDAGCCDGSNCIAVSLTRCAPAGQACQTCDPTLNDRCAATGCTCGTGASCGAGQQCLGGACVCNAASCPTAAAPATSAPRGRSRRAPRRARHARRATCASIAVARRARALVAPAPAVSPASSASPGSARAPCRAARTAAAAQTSAFNLRPPPRVATAPRPASTARPSAATGASATEPAVAVLLAIVPAARARAAASTSRWGRSASARRRRAPPGAAARAPGTNFCANSFPACGPPGGCTICGTDSDRCFGNGCSSPGRHDLQPRPDLPQRSLPVTALRSRSGSRRSPEDLGAVRVRRHHVGGLFHRLARQRRGAMAARSMVIGAAKISSGSSKLKPRPTVPPMVVPSRMLVPGTFCFGTGVGR